jgi:hypothetical protein
VRDAFNVLFFFSLVSNRKKCEVLCQHQPLSPRKSAIPNVSCRLRSFLPSKGQTAPMWPTTLSLISSQAGVQPTRHSAEQRSPHSHAGPDLPLTRPLSVNELSTHRPLKKNESRVKKSKIGMFWPKVPLFDFSDLHEDSIRQKYESAPPNRNPESE